MTLAQLARVIEARIGEVSDERQRSMGIRPDMSEAQEDRAYDDHWLNADSDDYEVDDVFVGQMEGLEWALARVREALSTAPRRRVR